MEKRVVRLAIREFVESLFMEGDLVSASSPGRAVEGMRVHRGIQAERGDGYTAEVQVNYAARGQYIELQLFGRIDGVNVDENGVTIEEIKSVRGFAPREGFDGAEVHWAQARVYAAVFCRDNGVEGAAVHLVYYDVVRSRTHRYERRYTAEELLLWLQALCERYLHAADREEERLLKASRVIRDMGFPYDRVRPGQQEMMAAVYEHVQSADCLYVSAPTGTGKTMGALFPAVKALADGHCRKIFYLTARNPVKAVAEEAVRTLIGRGFALRAVTMTAKDRACPMPEGTPCHPDFCRMAAGFYDRLFEALDEVPPVGHMARLDVERLAAKHELCPHELSLYIAEISDIVICDYNNAFDPRVKFKRFFERGGDYLLLVDEAHNLVDRGRDMFSAQLEEAMARSFLDSLPLHLGEGWADASIAAQEVINSLAALAPVLQESQQEETTLEEVPDALLRAVDAFVSSAEPLLAYQNEGGMGEGLMDLYFNALVFRSVAEEMDERYRVLLRRAGGGMEVHLRCLDPSKDLRAVLKKVRCAVFFSATLTPFQYYSRLTGTQGEASSLRLPSPFPQERLKVVALDVDTTYARRENSLPRLVEALSAFIGGRAGNYLVFFPSYRYMQQAHGLFREKNPGVFSPMQSSGMGDRDRAEFLRFFECEHEGGMAAFAVMGGIFGEGIDLAGEKLIGVAIVGVGMPQLCLERNLIQQYHDDREEAGYDFSYVIPGFNRVMQAVGRLIRHEEDRGVVLLADRRFGWRKYDEMTPEWWQPVTPARGAADVARAVRRFWLE